MIYNVKYLNLEDVKVIFAVFVHLTDNIANMCFRTSNCTQALINKKK